MSDGMTDANAVGELHQRLSDAAYALRDAIRAARDGHRGIAVNVRATVNEVLRRSGSDSVPYQLVPVWE